MWDKFDSKSDLSWLQKRHLAGSNGDGLASSMCVDAALVLLLELLLVLADVAPIMILTADDQDRDDVKSDVLT